MRRRPSGNVLFLILIAVLLFAALSYAVAHSARNSGSMTAGREKIKIAVAAAQQQALSYRMGIHRVMMMNGVRENELSFVNDIWPAFLNNASHYDNPDCAGGACRIFAADGGATVYAAPPADLTAKCKTTCPNYNSADYWAFSGNAFIPGIGTDALPELLTAFRVDQETCAAINDALGIANPSGAPPQIPGSGLVFTGGFRGVFGTLKHVSTTFPAEAAGRDTGCVNQQHATYSGNHAWFYYVLLAR